MNYEQKYKEALERAKTLYENANGMILKKWVERVFPELAESEDEKIRKEIISALKYANHKGVYDKHIAWLEKQGEQKHICKLDNSYAHVRFPFKAKVKSTDKIVTIHGGQLSFDGKEWIKYQSDFEDGYKIYEPNDLELVCEIEQKHAWSEEDEDAIEMAIIALEDMYDEDEPDTTYGGYNLPFNKAAERLKSLKDRIGG